MYIYPNPRRDDNIFDDYHGNKVADPYRWMEDPDAEETKEFVNAENSVTENFLASCKIRNKLSDVITDMWNYPRYSCPAKRGSKYFYSYNSGLQNQSVMYVQASLTAEASVFLDPNLLSEDGTTCLYGSSFSDDGLFFTYGLSKAGSDWITIQFKDVDSNTDLPDVLEMVKFSCMSWTHDNHGIFYNQYPKADAKADGTETASNLNQKLFYHRIGTPQSEDVLCAEWPDNPKWLTHLTVSHCGNYGIVTITEGCDPVNRLYFCDFRKLDKGISGVLPLIKVVDNFDAEYEYITNEGSLFTFKTNLNAPRYKLIQIDFDNFDQSNWKTLIDEHSYDVLEWASCVYNSKLILSYLHDCKNVLYVYDLFTGHKLSELPLDIGTVVGYSGKKKDTEIFYQFASFLTPGIIYHCDMTKEPYAPTIFREIIVKGFKPNDFVTEQKFYKSKDGTNIPMFLVHKKNITLDGSHPVLLYGYGGFNISITPSFSVSRIVFMAHLGGIFALPNIRGGGEYGETWHRGGMLANKQNVFDDFQMAAQYLIEENYTKASKITIQGGSNGGLLVGACVNQRPDLFGCAIAQVGVMDMLRFHKFTIGHAWTSDYGCSDKAEEFNWLIKYSPLHNVRAHPDPNVQYPALLLLTADHDDRVVPLHSLKFIAEVQHKIGLAESQTNPLMIRVDTKAGHGFGKSTTKTIEELRDTYAFITLVLNLQWQE